MIARFPRGRKVRRACCSKVNSGTRSPNGRADADRRWKPGIFLSAHDAPAKRGPPMPQAATGMHSTGRAPKNGNMSAKLLSKRSSVLFRKGNTKSVSKFFRKKFSEY